MSGLEAILAIVGVILALPTTIQTIHKVGISIEERVEAYDKVDENMRKFKLVGTTMARGLLKEQLLTVQEAVRQRNLDPDFINALDGVFREIVQDIMKAQDLFDKAYPRGLIRKLKYVSNSKDSLIVALDGFWRNQEIFQLMTQYVHNKRDRPSVFKLGTRDLVVHHETQNNMPGHFLPNSNIFLCHASYKIPGSDTVEEGVVVVEERETRSTDDIKAIDEILESVRSSNQARVMLPCIGYRITDQLRDGCTLFFRIPVPGALHSLLDFLQENPKLSLNQRVNICRQLAIAVSAIHGAGFVHKNIRPTNVLIVSDEADKRVFLTDWTSLRVAGEISTRVTTKDWDVSFYQHPERRANLVAHDYTLAHDIYSLGVCMLEVLLQRSFISMSPDSGLPVLCSDFRRRAIQLGTLYGLEESDYENSEKILQTPLLVKEILLKYAEDTLPWMTGDTLSKLVSKSLQGFDGEFPTAAAIQQQANTGVATRVEEGINYIQKVVQVLECIKIYIIFSRFVA